MVVFQTFEFKVTNFGYLYCIVHSQHVIVYVKSDDVGGIRKSDCKWTISLRCDTEGTTTR